MNWLVVSLVLSVVLTIVLNVALRLFPGAADRAAGAAARAVQPRPGEPQRRFRVIVPWKAMLLTSIVLTVLLNLVLR